MSGVTTRLEMALAPDRTASPLSWDWTDLTTDDQDSPVSIRRGVANSGSSDVQPASMSLLLNNGTGEYTPQRADSPHYPNLKAGMPVRAVVTGQRDPYLALTGEAGSSCSTPDNAALDITGDLSIAVEFECPLGVPPNDTTYWELASKWSVAANLSWRLLLAPIRGSLTLEWTTGGTTATLGFFDGRMAIPRPDAGIMTVGFYLDVDNGASGKTVTWYVARGKTITDLIAAPASYVHETQTSSGTTSIFSGTSVVEIGDNSGSSSNPPIPAKIRRLIMRSGTMSAGTIVANPVFTGEDPGETSFTDSAGRVWTVNSPASIIDDQVRMIGELESNSPIWPGHGVDEAAQAQWTVMGPLSRLRQGAKPLKSSMFRRVTTDWLVDNVVAYWPLEDGPKAAAGFSPLGDIAPVTVGGDWEWAADSSNPASHPLPHMDTTIAFRAQVAHTLRTVGKTQYRVELLVKIDTPNTTPSGTNIIGIEGSGTVKQWVIAVDDTNVAIVGRDAFGTALVTSVNAHSSAPWFGRWTLWSFNITQNGGNIDWSLTVVPSDTGLGYPYSGSVAGNVGTIVSLHNWNGAAPTSGGISYGHFIVTQGLPLGWLSPADTAYAGEPAGRRFYRLCQENGIQGLVDGVYSFHWEDAIPAGAKPMGPLRPATLLELLEECALVEGARIGESKELFALTYRTYQYNQTPALTVTTELTNPFEPTGDTQGLVNDVTVSLPGGTSHHQFDQDSIDSAGVYDSTRSINAYTLFQLPDLASWWLHEATWPELRVPSLRVELGRTPASFDSWLAVQMGDLIRFTTLPPWFPEPSIDVLVDGYTEELSAVHWALTLNVSPEGPWEVGIRDDADLGIRDTGGSVLDAEFEAGTDTSMDVETTLGPLWAVTAASNSALPFDINVGGARITVTAIGAAAGQVQTFTVTQTPVNGIVKTVPAGTAVSVWRPARRALMQRSK